MARERRGAFADLLDRTFSLISHTWKTSLLLGAVLFIPSSVFFGWAYGLFLDVFRDMGELAGGEPGPLLARMGIAYLWIGLAVLATGIVSLFVRACVTEQAARAVRGEFTTPWQVAAQVISRTYAPLLGQRVLQTAIVSITIFGVSLVVGIVVAIGAALKSELLAILAGSVLGLAGMGVVIWVSVRYTVTLESLVVDGTGIERSLDHSWDLVHGRWWRVFGYTILFGLMVSFASSLIATPIMFFSTFRQFLHNLEAVLHEAPDPEHLNQAMMRLFAGMGRRLGILQYVQSLAGGFVTPVFMTLLFFELKKPAAPAPAELVVQPARPAEPTA